MRLWIRLRESSCCICGNGMEMYLTEVDIRIGIEMTFSEASSCKSQLTKSQMRILVTQESICLQLSSNSVNSTLECISKHFKFVITNVTNIYCEKYIRQGITEVFHFISQFNELFPSKRLSFLCNRCSIWCSFHFIVRNTKAINKIPFHQLVQEHLIRK